MRKLFFGRSLVLHDDAIALRQFVIEGSSLIIEREGDEEIPVFESVATQREASTVDGGVHETVMSRGAGSARRTVNPGTELSITAVMTGQFGVAVMMGTTGHGCSKETVAMSCPSVTTIRPACCAEVYRNPRTSRLGASERRNACASVLIGARSSGLRVWILSLPEIRCHVVNCLLGRSSPLWCHPADGRIVRPDVSAALRHHRSRKAHFGKMLGRKARTGGTVELVAGSDRIDHAFAGDDSANRYLRTSRSGLQRSVAQRRGTARDRNV